jgi:hypothetical protein
MVRDAEKAELNVRRVFDEPAVRCLPSLGTPFALPQPCYP